MLKRRMGPWWLLSWRASVKVFEDTDWNEQRAAATGRGIMRMLACYEEILKEKKKSSSARLKCLISSSRLQELVHRHLYWRTVEVMVQMTNLHFKRKYRLCKLSFVCHISYFLQTFYMCLFFFLDQNTFSGTTYFSLTLRLWENLSPFVPYRLTSPVLESTTTELCINHFNSWTRASWTFLYPRKKSTLTESVVRFNVYVDIQAYSSWNPKKKEKL